MKQSTAAIAMDATLSAMTIRISKTLLYAFALGALAPSLGFAQVGAPPAAAGPGVPPAAAPPEAPAAAAPTAPPSDIVTPPSASESLAPATEATPPPAPPPPVDPLPPPSAPAEVPPVEPFAYPQAPMAPPPEPAPAMLRPPSKIPAYILWGAGGVSLIVGTIYGVSTLSAKSEFDDDPTNARADSVHNRSIVSDVGFGLGLVLGITGTVFYLIADQPVEAPPLAAGGPAAKKTRAMFAAGRGGGVLNLRF